MKAENISDALAFLDDDIIEEAESIRSRKKNHKVIWLRCLSAAACLCIALVAVFGALPYLQETDLPLRGENLKGDSQAGEPLFGVAGGGEATEDYKYGESWGNADLSITFPDDGVYLEITEWKRNYFYALVLSGKNEELKNGMKVKVKLSKVEEYSKYPQDGMKVKIDDDGNTKHFYWSGWDDASYAQGKPAEEDFPVGTKVCVTYSKVRNSFLNFKAEKVIKATHLYEYKGNVSIE